MGLLLIALIVHMLASTHVYFSVFMVKPLEQVDLNGLAALYSTSRLKIILSSPLQ